MKPIEYQLPKKKQRLFGPVKKILRLFYKKIKVVTLGPKLDENCLLLANHANKKGPLVYELFLPIHCVKWGAHEMLETYKKRWRYLRDVLYMQKNGVKKFKATIKATFEATFSKFFYRGIKVLPTYRDARVRRTFDKSVDVLNDGSAVMIYPENSDKGYFDVLTEFYSGFTFIAEKYYKVNGVDVPIRPVYYHKKKRIIVVGTPSFYTEMKNKGMKRDEMGEFMKNQVNDLYFRIENGEFDKN